MYQLIRDHKLPAGVTAAALVAVLGLASAPVLMAESDSEILARQNADKIAEVSASLESRTSELQQEFDARSDSYERAISSLENQISILNKASSRNHARQVAMMQPSGEIQSSISSLASNSDLRMSNI